MHNYIIEAITTLDLAVGVIIGLITLTGIFRKRIKVAIENLKEKMFHGKEARQGLQETKELIVRLEDSMNRSFNSLRHRVDEAQTGIKELRSQFYNNGGNNLWDRLDELYAIMLSGMNISDKNMLAIVDRSGKLFFSNRALQLLSEKQADDLLEYNWYNMISHADRQRFVQSWEKSLERHVDVDETYRMNNSKSTLVSHRGIRMKNGQGEFTGYYFIITPIENGS